MEIIMKIHTVEPGDTLSEIAKKHGTSVEMIKRDNRLDSDFITVGEQLLILTPTRTYLPKRSDSLSGISHRFGIKESELFASNPGVGDEIGAGRIMALKYEPRPYGSAAANGYYYRGCGTQKLKEVIPYLTYLTFAAAILDESGIQSIFDVSEGKGLIKDTGIIPLLKVFDGRGKRDFGRERADALAEKLVTAAKEGGYMGITLDFCDFTLNEDEVAEFLVCLRRRMIGADLILITETDENTPLAIGDYSDGCTLSQPWNEVSFTDGFKKRTAEYASESESGKTFIDLPLFANEGERIIPTDDAMATARRCGAELIYDEKSKLLFYDHKRRGRTVIPSLEYIKAILDAINEYGFMGISFDVGRVPLPYLMAYNSLFKTVKSTSVRSREGCSRGS